jgi:hypothetical protein
MSRPMRGTGVPLPSGDSERPSGSSVPHCQSLCHRARDVLYLFEKEDVTLSITSVWTLASISVPVHTPEKVPVGY